jgi:SRSO17 transposase
MDRQAAQGVALRFQAYIEHLNAVIGHADRREPLAAYCTGLLLPGERKSVEPMAARIAPDEVGAKHQSLHHFVAKTPWDEVRGAERSASVSHRRAEAESWLGKVGHQG